MSYEVIIEIKWGVTTHVCVLSSVQTQQLVEEFTKSVCLSFPPQVFYDLWVLDNCLLVHATVGPPTIVLY